ncbi:MAG TPA: entericidin EcnA/B family protein [Marivita sp.]|nr:entericidin EcnA/B family protein [Marivita sp.]
MRRWWLLIVFAGALSACATVDGIGQDISGSARTVQSWF